MDLPESIQPRFTEALGRGNGKGTANCADCTGQFACIATTTRGRYSVGEGMQIHPNLSLNGRVFCHEVPLMPVVLQVVDDAGNRTVFRASERRLREEGAVFAAIIENISLMGCFRKIPSKDWRCSNTTIAG